MHDAVSFSRETHDDREEDKIYTKATQANMYLWHFVK